MLIWKQKYLSGKEQLKPNFSVRTHIYSAISEHFGVKYTSITNTATLAGRSLKNYDKGVVGGSLLFFYNRFVNILVCWLPIKSPENICSENLE